MGHPGSEGGLISRLLSWKRRPLPGTPSTTNPTRCWCAAIRTKIQCRFSTITNASFSGTSRSPGQGRSAHQSQNCKIFSAQFSPLRLNYSVIVGSADPSFVRILESRKGEASGHVPGATVQGFAKGIYSVHADNSCRYLAAGCGDRFVTVMNVASAE